MFDVIKLLQDRVGNLFLVTSSGNWVNDQTFYAYGRLRRGIIGVERSFTGQQKDFGTGLIYFKARYYDPELGIFLSPDTLVPDAGNLFDWNRYMYVRGRAMNMSDPTGHEPIHHSNHPCSYTACVRDGGNIIPIAQYTPEIHQRYYGPGSISAQDRVTIDQVHTVLDAAGTVDPTGVCDAINFCLYAAQGDFANAGISGLAILPLGDVAKGLRYTDEAATFLGKTGKNVFDGLVDGQKLTQTDVLDAGMAFLGDGYKELDPGVFVSSDGTRMFRMTDADILGKHGAGPHANFEIVNPVKKWNSSMSYESVDNKHIYFSD